MAANEDSSQLADRVNEAQAEVQAAISKDRAGLQAEVEQEQSSARGVLLIAFVGQRIT